MSYVAKSMGIIMVVLLFDGCIASPSVAEKYPFNGKNREIVQYDEENSYYRPKNSWSHRLDANTAYINTIASSELLECKENDIWFISMNSRKEEGKVRYRYFISLTKSHLMDMKDDPTYIPRKDSKEFKDLMDIDTIMARQGLIGCSSKMSKQEVVNIKTQK